MYIVCYWKLLIWNKTVHVFFVFFSDEYYHDNPVRDDGQVISNNVITQQPTGQYSDMHGPGPYVYGPGGQQYQQGGQNFQPNYPRPSPSAPPPDQGAYGGPHPPQPSYGEPPPPYSPPGTYPDALPPAKSWTVIWIMCIVHGLQMPSKKEFETTTFRSAYDFKLKHKLKQKHTAIPSESRHLLEYYVNNKWFS